ncbi:MAG: 3'(2'),5'-bisphosphate nucleotidase [Bacteroidia bacterium]|nr:MAG: 3'(2'),5'-bisphosphate nucleotidase [Bacteroidia bacterium]
MVEDLKIDTLKRLLAQAVQAAMTAAQEINAIYATGQFDVNIKENAAPITRADRKSHDIITEHLSFTRIPTISEEGRHVRYDERQSWRLLWLIDPLDGTREFIKINDEFTVNIALIQNGQPHIAVIVAPSIDTLYFALKGHGAYKISKFNFQGTYTECELDEMLPRAQRLPLPASPRPYTIFTSRSNVSAEMHIYRNLLRKLHPDLDVIVKGSSLKICLVAEGKADLYARINPTSEWDTAAGQLIAEEAGCQLVDLHTMLPLRYNRQNLLNPPFAVKHPYDDIPKL